VDSPDIASLVDLSSASGKEVRKVVVIINIILLLPSFRASEEREVHPLASGVDRVSQFCERY
jgi:hypothetical protein